MELKVSSESKKQVRCFFFCKKIKKFWEEHRKPADDAETEEGK
jgi:hypothetical protein